MDATATPSELSAPSSFVAAPVGGPAMEAGRGTRDPEYPKHSAKTIAIPTESRCSRLDSTRTGTRQLSFSPTRSKPISMSAPL
jgi:hypothetical protein